jgi:hypothetical protein
MNTHPITRSLATLVAYLVTASGFAGDPIPTQQFAKLHTLIKPKAEEQKWEQIPWLVSLWEARQRAAEEGKPILLWEMDGHPLGCT